ncbi:MAG TPA: hypothetical protein VET24_01080 [Actinomycetota bacterium]|nr:hypothetical protein [Actinomycetota bacterium]
MSFTRKGMLAVYWNADNLSAKDANDQSAPTAVFFQYNPAETTRTLKLTLETESAPKGGDALSVSREADEDFAFKLELDATDGLERGDDAPITRDRGVVPQLLLLQSLLHTTGPAPIAKAVKKKGQQVPRGRIPFTMLVLDSERAVPVRITSLTIHASEFDANLNPVHATADVSFKVLLPQDLSKSDPQAAQFALDYWLAPGEPATIQDAVKQMGNELVPLTLPLPAPKPAAAPATTRGTA